MKIKDTLGRRVDLRDVSFIEEFEPSHESPQTGLIDGESIIPDAFRVTLRSGKQFYLYVDKEMYEEIVKEWDNL